MTEFYENDLVGRASKYAWIAHTGQVRKYTGEDYIVHLREVAELVQSTGLEPEVTAAAWLHDIVEDCESTIDDITAQFGARVGRLVHAMTDEAVFKGGPTRAERKERTRQRFLLLQGQDSIDAHTLKVADCISNVPSIRDHDPRFWEVFKREVERLLDVLVLAHPGLKDRLCDELGVPRRNHDKQSVWRREPSTDKYFLN